MAVNSPPRPDGVPIDAAWNAELGAWELCGRGPGGARHGECLTFRPDGTLHGRLHYVAGVQEGPFTLYHSDGTGVARRGTCVAGRVEGVVACFPGPGQPLRACCVPAAAVRMDCWFEAGEQVQEVFFDAEGRPMLSDGQRWPARPPGVPEDAVYDEAGGGWCRRRPTQHRFWTATGVLEREIDYPGGAARTERTYDGDGRVVHVVGLDADSRRDGPFLRRYDPGTSPYADARIREERGAFESGQAVGAWTFLDEAGAVVRVVERGAAFGPGAEASVPVFADDPEAGGGEWRTRARGWRGEGRVREALCAEARAAAHDGDAAGLVAALAETVVPVLPAVAAEQGDALVQATGVAVAQILDAWMGGADPASALCVLAGVLPGASGAALELVEAALLLAPERASAHLTRALIRLQHGDRAGAESDLAVVDGEGPQAAAALRGYMSAVFRPFDFWPAREPLDADPTLADVGAGIIRDAGEIRRVMGVYATRLQAWGEAIRDKLRGRPFDLQLPDTANLLPDGPVALRCEQAVIPDESGDGEQTVQVDERIETAALGVPGLLAEAQADWGALCWLCWAVGLDQVALPPVIAERPLLPVAMKTIVTRCWRAQDRLNTGGLLARANQVPGFTWCGMGIDAAPQHVARTIAEEYLRARAMFMWLASPDVASPFQIDLRND